MAKVQIKNEKITPFGGIYFVTKQFKHIERAIDEYLGRRCVSVGYQYGEIVRAMMGNFFCGGDRLYRLVCRVRIIAHSSRANTTCRPITRWGKGAKDTIFGEKIVPLQRFINYINRNLCVK